MSQPTRPTITVGTIHELNQHYARGKCSLAISSRTEMRDGQLFGLGGLDWLLVTPAACYETVTAEYEALPDLPVVRDGWPFASFEAVAA
jgi:hypothetical protein